MSKTQDANANYIYNIVTSTGGSICSINCGLAMFATMESKKKKGTPWKVDLEIGPAIRINITGYINLRREAPKSWKKCLTHDNGEVCEIKAVTTYVRNNEKQDEVEWDNLIESYKYGSQQITVNGENSTLFQLLHFILHEFDNVHFAPYLIPCNLNQV